MAISDRPTGDPRNWTSAQWTQYNHWEAAQPEPPMWGPYENAEQWYSSAEFVAIARRSLDEFRLDLGEARRTNNTDAVAFYVRQIKLAERALGIVPEPPVPTVPQLPLFFWEATG